MSPRVSVIVAVDVAVDRAAVESLDDQTLGPDEFEVLVVPNRSDHRSAQVEHLLSRRTNYRWLEPADDPTGAATGTYVVALRPGWRLQPHALERLCDLADETSAEVCLGRTSRPGPVRPQALPTSDVVSLTAEDQAAAEGSGRIHRRESLLGADLAALVDPSAHELPPRTPPRTAWLRSCPVFVAPPLPGPAVSRQELPVKARVTAATWEDGALLIDVTVRTDQTEVAVVVHRRSDGEQWPVPSEEVPSPDGSDERHLRATLRPGDVAGGAALSEDLWWPALVVQGERGARRVRLRTGTFASRSTVHEGTALVCYSDDKRLALDVGGRQRPLVPRLRASDARVTETWRGSALEIAVPAARLALAQGQEVPGDLVIGDLAVPATCRAGDEGPVLTAFVSGLGGRYELRARFAGPRATSLGLDLVVDPAGTMSVAAHPADPPATRPDPAGEPRRGRALRGLVAGARGARRALSR